MMTELNLIQSELKAPKGQFNKFGGYSYRSCEDILEAVKPLLSKHLCTLIISDEMIMLGNRFYVKATAIIKNSEKEEISVTAYARESENRKGMDDSQITGSASSYARKYALNGLFLIDDTKDADATNDHGKAPVKKQSSADNSKLLTDALKLVNDSKTLDELQEVWTNNAKLHASTAFKKAVNNKKSKLV